MGYKMNGWSGYQSSPLTKHNDTKEGTEEFEFAVKTAPLFIGGNNDAESANAILDEVKIYNTVLSDVDVALLAIRPDDKEKYPLDLNVSGQGSVTKYLNGFPTDDTAFIAGSEIELVATPVNGFNFLNWSGDVSSTEDTITIEMDSAINLNANFEEGTAYELKVEKGGDGQGTITDKSGWYKEGMSVELTAEADSAFVFVGWTGDYTSTDETITITIDSNITVVAIF
jgi:uncharacterized repeat protein (TIGR02543 family)